MRLTYEQQRRWRQWVTYRQEWANGTLGYLDGRNWLDPIPPSAPEVGRYDHVVQVMFKTWGVSRPPRTFWGWDRFERDYIELTQAHSSLVIRRAVLIFKRRRATQRV